MTFQWNFENLKAELDAIDTHDPVFEFEINAVIDSMDRSLEAGRLTAGEAQSLLLKIWELQTKHKQRN